MRQIRSKNQHRTLPLPRSPRRLRREPKLWPRCEKSYEFPVRSASSSAESSSEWVIFTSSLLLHFSQQPIDEGEEMRQAFMSTQEGVTTYLEDMTLYEHFEPGDCGACRRR